MKTIPDAYLWLLKMAETVYDILRWWRGFER